VAGTNGKGSTSHMIASVLQESGLKVGLYTSPHLKDFRERIRIDGICIDEKNVIDFISANKTFLEKQKVSFFEMTVAMAFDFFAKEKVDIAVVEVGLGGRLDSTNILIPEVSVITNIGLDHTQFLGETIEEIAFEKAGIIKDGIPVVIGEKHKESEEVFKNIAVKHHADIYFAEDLIKEEYKTDLKGDYQQKNIKTAVQTLRLLKEKGFELSESDLEIGLQHVKENTGLKGRWEILQEDPKIICDTAHNYEGLSLVLNQLLKEKYKTLHIVLGVVNDKNLDRILPLFPKDAVYYFCRPDIPRGMDAGELQQEALKYGLRGELYPGVKEALSEAGKNSRPDDLIYVGGSTFVVAELPI
jgi:dihydrofolate synthase/folylpolyglutamate synthase